MISSRVLVPIAALAAAVLAASAHASIIQIDRISPTNEYGTGGYVQRTGSWNNSFNGLGTATTTEPQFGDITVSATLGRTGNSGSNSLLYSFNLTSQANWTGEQSLSYVTMQLTFNQSTTATLDILNRTARSGDQFRYAEVAGSANTGPTANDWNWISATGQFTNTFAAGTYTFVVEFYNFGGGPTGATALSGTWAFQQAGGGGGGVPLPGAAGLAACGLACLSRRRRR